MNSDPYEWLTAAMTKKPTPSYINADGDRMFVVDDDIQEPGKAWGGLLQGAAGTTGDAAVDECVLRRLRQTSLNYAWQNFSQDTPAETIVDAAEKFYQFLSKRGG